MAAFWQESRFFTEFTILYIADPATSRMVVATTKPASCFRLHGVHIFRRAVQRLNVSSRNGKNSPDRDQARFLRLEIPFEIVSLRLSQPGHPEPWREETPEASA